MIVGNANKPILDTRQQINHLKENGVTFNLYSEDKAYEYLRNNNNYFKLTAYRKNFEKYNGGVNDGKYKALDFEQLRDMAVIDMKLRYTLVQLALDIEHYSKLKILRCVEDGKEDGYQICEDFLNSMNEEQKERLIAEISRNDKSVYCGDLFKKYPDHFPVWVFLEMIPFGRLVSFYKFCGERFSDGNMIDEYYLLLTCKEIRNAAAHSSCILNDLHLNTSVYKTRRLILEELRNIKEISAAQRKKRMSNERVRQIVTLLFTHNLIVTSKNVHDEASDLLRTFKQRMNKNLCYYKENDLVQKTLLLFTEITEV